MKTLEAPKSDAQLATAPDDSRDLRLTPAGFIAACGNRRKLRGFKSWWGDKWAGQLDKFYRDLQAHYTNLQHLSDFIDPQAWPVLRRYSYEHLARYRLASKEVPYALEELNEDLHGFVFREHLLNKSERSLASLLTDTLQAA